MHTLCSLQETFQCVFVIGIRHYNKMWTDLLTIPPVKNPEPLEIYGGIEVITALMKNLYAVTKDYVREFLNERYLEIDIENAAE